MPVVTDPNIVKATVALKRSQTRLTHLRRRHLEGDFIQRDEVKSFVLGLALDFRGELLSLPARIKREVQQAGEIKNGAALEDAVEAAVFSWMKEFSERPLPETPKPIRSKGAYTSPPGPRKGSKMKSRKPRSNGTKQGAAE